MPVSRLPGGIARRFRFMVTIFLAPLFLSACYFDEVTEERHDIEFVHDGSIRVAAYAEGTLISDLRQESEEERQSWLAEARAYYEESFRDFFGDGFDSLRIEIDDPDRTVFAFEGRFLPGSEVPESIPGGFHLRNTGSGRWELRFRPSDNLGHPVTVCVTLAANWAVLDQPERFPPVSPGATQCGNRTELQRSSGTVFMRLVRLSDDGTPMDDRPGVEETHTFLLDMFEGRNAAYNEVLSLDVHRAQRAADLPLDAVRLRFSVDLRARQALFRTLEIIDGTHVLGPAAAAGDTASLSGTIEWGLASDSWRITGLNYDDREALSQYGFNTGAAERAGWTYVFDGTPEADALRAGNEAP